MNRLAFGMSQRPQCIQLSAEKLCIWRPLRRRHNQLLQLLGYGYTDREAAQHMRIGLGTVRTYLAQMRVSLHVSTLSGVRRLARDWIAGKIRIYAEMKRERV